MTHDKQNPDPIYPFMCGVATGYGFLALGLLLMLGCSGDAGQNLSPLDGAIGDAQGDAQGDGGSGNKDGMADLKEDGTGDSGDTGDAIGGGSDAPSGPDGSGDSGSSVDSPKDSAGDAKLPLGAPCSSSYACQSGFFCTDGVCCLYKACTDFCFTCAAGTNGAEPGKCAGYRCVSCTCDATRTMCHC